MLTVLDVAANRKSGEKNTIAYVSRNYYGGYMIDRNHRLVESAGLLLAVYSGARQSGTGATVNYGRKLRRGIIIIDPPTRPVAYDRTVVYNKIYSNHLSKL